MWRESVLRKMNRACLKPLRSCNRRRLDLDIASSGPMARSAGVRDGPSDREHAGKVYRIAGVIDDVTERKQALEQIKTSLNEKEVLLKEIHHRVKNNMQVITSLLSLQSRNIGDGQALEVFQDSQNRVKSMALIHETLYQSKDLSRINFAEYLQKLVAHVSRSYRLRHDTIRINVKVDDVSLPIDTAVPCGLIINE